jgi:hypothetical protein
MTRTERWRDAAIDQRYPRSFTGHNSDDPGDYVGMSAATSGMLQSAQRSNCSLVRCRSQRTLVILHGHS